jgi:DNA repair/transcription protein MET18/MMS19
MAGAFCEGVFVRSLGAADRAVALGVLRVASETRGQALLDADLDLLECALASVDGEKDPRCLLEGFAAVRALLALYQRQPPSSLLAARLEEAVEELFDVLSCYFPVTFTPPPGDPHRITRAQIAAQLEATLAACPAFAPHVVPLFMEKLSSTVRQAKVDALSGMGACAEAYGAAALADHVDTFWAALRAELAAPAAEGLPDAEVAAAEELAGEAAACLTRCVQVRSTPAAAPRPSRSRA